eukprot:SAG31_NODE_44741_length_261_cov_1.055556_1_plen_40_part_01
MHHLLGVTLGIRPDARCQERERERERASRYMIVQYRLNLN